MKAPSVEQSSPHCAHASGSDSEHPDHRKQLPRLKKIEGQVRGVQKMIDEGRYCLDIISQVRAISGALHQVELRILQAHLDQCVRQAIHSQNTEDAENKIQEILHLLNKAS
jgi:DNA-binding FrmR family transcriptional regulator